MMLQLISHVFFRQAISSAMFHILLNQSDFLNVSKQKVDQV